MADLPVPVRPGQTLLLPDPRLAEALGIPVMPFRIRAEALGEVKGEDGQMHLDVLVDEWAKVLADDRELRVAEGPAVALWANVVATQRGQDGDGDGAEHYCRLGLQFAPTNLTLRTKLGLALLQRGEPAQALVQFKQAMEDPRTGFGPTLWLAAARTAAHLGLHGEAVRILEEFAAYLPGDDAFWDLLGHEREQAGLGPPRIRPEEPAGPAGWSAGWTEVPRAGGAGDAWETVDDDWKEVKD